jgi:AraC family transcriptional regulator
MWPGITARALPLPAAVVGPSLLDIFEVFPTKGEWIAPPAADEFGLSLSLNNFSAARRESERLRSEDFGAGTVSICPPHHSRRMELRRAARFLIVVLGKEVLDQARLETRQMSFDLQAQYSAQDPTLRHLMELLLREKREGFQSGPLFLDGVATALASCLVRRHSGALPVHRFAGGMTPLTLRRCVEFMEAHLDEDLRLHELAREAGVSTSHFIRSFRRSTGQTPHQFLLHRRVRRAQSLMRDRRISLTEVALASGFADQHHLARVFRRIARVTPSSYRRALR